MPVPGCYVYDDAASFDRTMQNSRHIGKHESQHAASQVQAVHCSENVNEGTAGAAGEVKTFGGKLAPNEELPGKEQEAKDGGHGKPGEVAFVAQRDAWNRSHRGESSFSRDFAPRQIDGDAAHDKDGCIDEQQNPRQSDRNPGSHVRRLAHIETQESAPNEVDRCKGNEEHEDGRHGDGESHPSATQALAIIRQRVGQAVAAIAPAAVITSAATSAGAGRERGAVVARVAR